MMEQFQYEKLHNWVVVKTQAQIAKVRNYDKMMELRYNKYSLRKKIMIFFFCFLKKGAKGGNKGEEYGKKNLIR